MAHSTHSGRAFHIIKQRFVSCSELKKIPAQQSKRIAITKIDSSNNTPQHAYAPALTRTRERLYRLSTITGSTIVMKRAVYKRAADIDAHN